MERADLEQWKAREVARLLALVETERRYYQEIIATLPVGLVVVAGDLSIISANRAVRKIFGLRGGSVRGRLDTLVPASVIDHVQQVLTTGVSQNDLLVSTERNEGRQLRIGIQTVQNWDEGEQEALLTIEDVTDLQRLPDAVESTGLPPAELLANLEATVWAAQIPGMNFLFVNAPGKNLLGFETVHWLERAEFWKERIHPADRDWVLRKYQDAMDRPVEHASPVVCEYRALTAGGGAIWVRETARLLADAGSGAKYWIGISVDITERRRLEEQLVQSNRVDAAGRLAGRLAHDINNVLMILTGYGEELLGHIPVGNALRADVQEILTATGRMGSITSQLLAFTRRQPGTPAAIDLAGALNGMQQVLRDALGGSIEMEILPAPRQIAAIADLAQLQQVMVALVRHAREASTGGGKLTIGVSTTTIAEDMRRPDAPLRPGDYAVITLQDSGRQLDAEARVALFELFLSGKNAGESGPLLSRAYAFVRQWDGDISVGGASGQALFQVFLPLTAEPVLTAPREVEQPPVATPAPQPRPETILVVEDEAGIRSLVRKILRRQGYEVLEAANGLEAIEICQQHASRIDLLVSDVVMPEMGGRELVEQLKSRGWNMKVLYVSGFTDDPSIYSGNLPPGTAFLQKPFTLGSLLEKVKEVLAMEVTK